MSQDESYFIVNKSDSFLGVPNIFAPWLSADLYSKDSKSILKLFGNLCTCFMCHVPSASRQ